MWGAILYPTLVGVGRALVVRTQTLVCPNASIPMKADSSPENDRSGGNNVREYDLSLCNVGELLAELGIAINQATVRIWWSRVGRMIAT